VASHRRSLLPHRRSHAECAPPLSRLDARADPPRG
jgi:hypothetical protein